MSIVKKIKSIFSRNTWTGSSDDGSLKTKALRTDTDTLKQTPLALGYGYAVYPKDWIEINPEHACSSKYVYVFEGRHHDLYHVPHFIYFTNIWYYDIPARDVECEKMDNFIIKYDANCACAFNCQGRNYNDKAFIPGHFELPDKGSLMDFIDDNEYPFGAHIVRPEKPTL